VLGDLTYEYDKAGNRTKIGGTWARTGMPQSLTNTSYDTNNRQLSFGDKTLTYDDNGNLTTITDSSGTTIYQWNARNQLSGINGPNVNASFAYDGAGRREKKTINGSLTEFLYDGVNPVQETSGASVLANILTGLGIDEFLTRTDIVAGTTIHFLPDALGSPLALADSGGAISTDYIYEPFGRTATTGVWNTNPVQYSGRENDGNGLYYYRNRYYHPGLGRFISEDPLRFSVETSQIMEGPVGLCADRRDVSKLSENFYVYVANNPILYTDPLGLDKKPPDCKPPPGANYIGTTYWQKCTVKKMDAGCIAKALSAAAKCSNCLAAWASSSFYYFPPSCADCLRDGAGTAGCLIQCEEGYTVPVYSGEYTSGLCECRGKR
jgi:RHS repeat-associated protein